MAPLQDLSPSSLSKLPLQDASSEFLSSTPIHTFSSVFSHNTPCILLLYLAVLIRRKSFFVNQ